MKAKRYIIQLFKSGKPVGFYAYSSYEPIGLDKADVYGTEKGAQIATYGHHFKTKMQRLNQTFEIKIAELVF